MNDPTNSFSRSADDRLDALIAAAGSRQWPGPARNHRVEEFLMNQSQRKQGSLLSRLGIWLGVGAVAVTGVVCGANRFYDRYLVQGEINGKPFEAVVEPGPDGTATFEVATEDGGLATVIVGFENVESDGKIHVGIDCQNCPATGCEMTVQTEAVGAAGSESKPQPSTTPANKQ